MSTLAHVSRIVGVVVLAGVATRAAAQQKTACPTGPGAAFGITSYQCANCAFKQANGERPTYSFFSEPVVLQTNGATAVNAGDVIEAVNGKPITTGEGGDQFTYPAGGENSITVRRGRDRQVIRVTVAGPGGTCDNPMATAARSPVAEQTRMDSLNVGPKLRVRGVGPGPLGSQPIIFVDGVRIDGATGTPIEFDRRGGRYGFAVACLPSCTAATANEEHLQYTYYKYDSFPPIVGIRPGSPAESAGLRIGDLVMKVDGRLVVEPEGALRLANIDKKETLSLTVRRDGKDVEFLLKTTR